MSRDVTTSFGCDYILQQVAAGQIASAGMVAVSYVQRISEKVTGGSLEESKEALAIAETGATLFCTVGVHPTRCKEFEGSGDPEKHLQDLLTLTKEGKEKGKVVAIGECGLDYDRLHFYPSDIQKKYFEKQFELAYTTKLPMFLHMRAAAQDFCDILQRIEDQ
ncbi:deoxyribonuclease TATDN1 [Capsicum annuum]|uniref:deoxyribonuclease TATDN1 n=1 Tax=Capsicum annuum TaxID=4072 RepID=UPI001FB07028|nr:deoxyribonuclease TATDN1 [Capsicum annuum]